MISYKASLTPTGATGAASASAALAPAGGRLYAVYLDYASGITSATDVTVTVRDPAVTLFTRANSATDGWFFPRVRAVSSAGTSYTGGAQLVVCYPVTGQLILNVASSTPTTNAVVGYVYVET